MSAPHAITSLTLERFRNYASLSLQINPSPVVLTGHNGAGKTNILEAISLLAPGRGMRNARLRDMDFQGSAIRNQCSEEKSFPPSDPRSPIPDPWVVAAEVTTNGTKTHIGTGRDSEATSEKRILKINGERERKQAVLTGHACIQWLTPAMDQVFMEGGTARRKLVDRLVYGFDAAHAARVNAYESSMRERNRLLADRGRADPYWLSVLEQQMAEHAVAMTLARIEHLARIREHLVAPLAGFPRAEIRLQGTLEAWLEEGASALDAEAKLAVRLHDLRMVDGASGRASVGPHRSEVHVIHQEKSMAAERCSTGEQKAVLLSLILAAARARAVWCGVPPILLLDEVVAHLDVDKRGQLFDLIRQCRIQAWMTGTDAADFQGLEGDATHLEIAGAAVQIKVENR